MPTFDFATQIQGPIAVVGDVHGQAEKLSVVLDRVRSLPEYQRRWIVFIGDMVDRGPDPKSVIDIILNLMRKHERTTAIMGNHEFAMCCALGWLPQVENSTYAQRWVDFYNSTETFNSYGATVGDLSDLAAKVPEDHRSFLLDLPWCIEHPNLLFVHAGLDPFIPFNVQMGILQRRDFSLTRPSWLFEKSFVAKDPPADCPFTLVSGHVRVEEVVFRPRRILVDTTGGEGGDLSCVLMPERLLVSSDPRQRGPLVIGEHEPDDEDARSSWWKIWK